MKVYWKALNKKFRRTGISNGLISGLTYGIYSTLVMVASGYDPLVSAAGILAAPFICSGLNDLFAGIFLLFFNVFYKKKEKNSNCDWIHHFCSLAVAAFEC